MLPVSAERRRVGRDERDDDEDDEVATAVGAGFDALAVVRPAVRLAPPRQPAHVLPGRAGAVLALELLLRLEAVLVPLLILGDAEVDERAVPDVREAHDARMVSQAGADGSVVVR